jgi:hypothetical protein
MEKPKIITLKKATKDAFSNLSENASLGFLFKSALVAIILIGIFSFAMLTAITLGMGGSVQDPAPAGTYPPAQTTGNGIDTNMPEGSLERENSLYSPEESEEFISTSEPEYAHPTPPSVGTIIFFAVAGILSFIVVSIATTYFFLIPIKIHQQELTSPKELLKEAVRKTPGYVMLTFVTSSFVMLGYVLLVIPGIILTLMYLFAPFIYLIEDTRPFEAIKRSKELTKGIRGNLFKKGVLFVIIYALLLIPLLILMYLTAGLITYPLISLVPLILVKIYEDVKRVKGEQVAETTKKPSGEVGTAPVQMENAATDNASTSNKTPKVDTTNDLSGIEQTSPQEPENLGE